MELGLIYDPAIVLNMQSANSEVDRSLGLAHNVPICERGPDDNHSRSQFRSSSHGSDHATRATTPFVETTEFLDIEN